MNSELLVFKSIKILGERFNNWPNDLSGANVHKTLASFLLKDYQSFLHMHISSTKGYI